MTYRILLFDDDYESMLPLKSELDDRGHQVDLTADAQILAALGVTKYDLVSIDFMIHPQSPAQEESGVINNVHYDDINWQRTGQEFLRRLRKGEYESGSDQGTLRNVPAIIISATAKSNENFGAAAFFEKPFDVEEILNTVDKLLQSGMQQG